MFLNKSVKKQIMMVSKYSSKEYKNMNYNYFSILFSDLLILFIYLLFSIFFDLIALYQYFRVRERLYVKHSIN